VLFAMVERGRVGGIVDSGHAASSLTYSERYDDGCVTVEHVDDIDGFLF